MTINKLVVSLFFYSLTVLFLYAIGYAFDVEWLMFHKETYFSDGSLKESSGSVIPFFLSFPVFLLMVKRRIFHGNI
ncbi:hypothetical protein [Bacillus sp. 03113]|uniref:hypothetical protein n=1 Tax=Bacillus sp. 03113 TaxID=2578211 RepID=UPI0011416958|nr:hypothetical protein [Bacillus sp. 03113]